MRFAFAVFVAVLLGIPLGCGRPTVGGSTPTSAIATKTKTMTRKEFKDAINGQSVDKKNGAFTWTDPANPDGVITAVGRPDKTVDAGIGTQKRWLYYKKTLDEASNKVDDVTTVIFDKDNFYIETTFN